MLASAAKNSLANVMAEFDSASEYLGISKDVVAFVREPRCSMKLSLPVRRDDGSMVNFRGYHTIHSPICGPTIGGVQCRPDIDLEMVEALAFWSTHRCALLGVPFGGSYGAIAYDPDQYSAAEQESVSRRYIAELSKIVGPQSNIFTADIGSNQQTMCWFMDTYASHRGDFIPAVVLGKPVDIGGVAYRVHPTAIGAELCIRKACDELKLPLKGLKVAIQGFGKVGMSLAKLLHDGGAKITAVSDISGTYINDNGISIDEVVWHQSSYGILDGLEAEVDVEKLDIPADIFKLPVELIVCAAIELQITEENMQDVKASIIAEIAHDPVSPEADRYLHGKGVRVIPDILCNSGGVSGYYLEWVQNNMGYYWDKDRMTLEVQKIVGRAFDNVMSMSKEQQIPMRLAAAALALRRLVKTAGLRGIYA